MPGKRHSPSTRHFIASVAIVFAVATTITAFSVPRAFALTDKDEVNRDQQALKDKNDGADEPAAAEDEAGEENQGIPMPDSLVRKPGQESEPESKKDDKADTPAVPTEFIFDLNTLPQPVKKLRVAIVEAAASGDIERLRPLLSSGSEQTQLSVGDAPDDPIDALKALSGDKEGREVLGILLDIISTPAAHTDKGTPNELYVWPYFAEKSLDTLSPPEIVELYRIVTAGDVAEMKQFGGYNFYRIGISPDGKWKFFVAGD